MRFAFRPSRKGLSQVLGELESRVMKEVWRAPGSTAREILGRLDDRRPLAYTTVFTILDRLHKKGLLTRVRKGKAFSYRAAVSREEFDERLTQSVLEGLLKERSRPILNTFVDLVSTDETLLEELEELVKRKRR